VRRLIASLALLLFAGAAASASAQDMASARAGQALAEQVCAACHAIGKDTISDRSLPQAPAFVTLANMPEMNAVSLSAFLITPHPTMPNLMLSSEEASDVIAYIMSLRQPR
jgi:cytochrome c